MVATKAALSIRVDALSDADGKSEEQAPSIGMENRAKLEARLHALEQQADGGAVRSAFAGKKQARFEMSGETRTYNTAADAVELVPTQREPVEAAVKAVLDVKAEKKKAKEERKAKRRAEKEQIAEGIEEARMDVDEDDEETKENKKEKKRKRRESDGVAMDVDPEEKVWRCTWLLGSPLLTSCPQRPETEEERKARKKARKAEKAAAAAASTEDGEAVNGDAKKKKKRKSEA